MLLSSEQVISLRDQYPMLNGSVMAAQFDNGRLACVVPFMFTWAIVADLNFAGYDERWCYETLLDAVSALKEWNGEGEPEGWHRHPNTGRRRDKYGGERVQF